LDNCAELGEWLAHHREGFERTAEQAGVKLSLRRVPAICAVCQDADWSSSFSDPKLIAALAERRGTDSYVLTVHENAGGREVQNADSTLFSDLRSDSCGPRWLEIVGRDTVPCDFVHVEATGEMVSGAIILLAFEHAEDLDARTVLLMPKQDGSRPEIIFQFSKAAFHELDERLVVNAKYPMNNTKGG